MEKRKAKKSGIPKFADEQDEAKWWASAEGRTFLKQQSLPGSVDGHGGSKMVAKLARANSVQIALRLPSPDLAKARAIAERKGIGYQTLLKMLVHEGLQRVER
jgi:predicted DNA binding CopG/RHH family protein